MIRFLLVYGARLPGTTWPTWFPVKVIEGGPGITFAKALSPLPTNYWSQALFRFDPLRGMGCVWAEDRSGDHALTVIARTNPLDDPLLGKVLASMLPDKWQEAWAVPPDPKPFLAPRI